MYNVSNNYKNYIKNSLSLSSKCKIVVNNTTYDGSIIKAYPKIIQNCNKSFGEFPAKKVGFEIYNLSNNLNFENKEISVFRGLYIDSQIEWVPQGVFIPSSSNITTNISSKTITVKDAQDRTQLFDVPYVSTLSWDNNQTHSGLEIVNDICTQIGIELSSIIFNWSSYQFKQPNFKEGLTCREVIRRIAEIGNSVAFINRDGKLEIKSRTTTNEKIERKRYINLTKENIIGPYNTLVLGKDGYNDDVIYPEAIEVERVECKILDNPFVDLYREEMIESVASYFIGTSYIPFELSDFVDGFYYDLNDEIEIVDKNGNSFKSVILNYETTSRIKSEVGADTESKSITDYNLVGSQKQELKQVKLDVNHINNQITSIVSSVEETDTKVSEIEQTVSGLSTTVKTVTKEVNKTVKTVTKQYKIKGTTVWQDTYPDRQEGQIVMAREKYTASDGTITYGTEYELTGDKGDTGSVGEKGDKGDKGDIGATGNGISKIDNYYARSTTQTAPSSITSKTIPTLDSTNKYLWQKKVITYTDNTTSEEVALIGVYGDTGAKGDTGDKGDTGASGKDGTNGNDGRGISTINYYYKATTTQTTPSASEITSTTIPTLSSTNKYLWQKEITTFSDTTTDTKISLIGVYGDTGAKGDKGDQGIQGIQGIQGEKGVDGTSTYFYVRYSANASGNPMTTTPNENTQYMGVASTTNSTAPTSYTDYTWSKTKGNAGAQGTPGATGADGKTSYLHIKYSEDGETFTPADTEYAEGEKPSAYIGQYTDFNATDSTIFSDYTWYKFTEDIDPTLNQIQDDINGLDTEINNNYQEIKEKFNGYTPISRTYEVEKSVTQLQTDTYTKTEINIKLTDGSVTKVQTISGTFDEDGMHYEKSGARTSSTINESGVIVNDTQSSEELLFAGYDNEIKESIVRTENLTVRKYFICGNYSRFEEYTDEDGNEGTGVFDI